MGKLLTSLIFLSAFFTLSFSYEMGNNNDEPVRGVWLTNVDSKVLNSKEGIIEAVKLCKENGFNTIFVVTWNKAMTTYPSKIMKEFTGVEIDTQITWGDPLKFLIEESHKNNIKVIAWFEFGFSSSFKENGGVLLKLKPHWRSVDNKGNLVTKNGFEWMNGFHPEVQDFLLSLIMEVVQNYDIDGIQGDDRLPAMPSESGYDEYTVNLYKKEFGKLPPIDFKDSAWVDWRAKKLNEFMRKIYKTVKGYKKDLIVSMAPNLYPWCKEEYLQDWPTWVKEGILDQIIPQLYRYDIKDYVNALEQIIKLDISRENISKFSPGILLKLGDYYAPVEYLEKAIEANRKQGINGEVFFFFEGLRKYPNLFKDKFYKN